MAGSVDKVAEVMSSLQGLRDQFDDATEGLISDGLFTEVDDMFYELISALEDIADGKKEVMG